MLNNALTFIQIESDFWIINLKSYVEFYLWIYHNLFIPGKKKQIFFFFIVNKKKAKKVSSPPCF